MCWALVFPAPRRGRIRYEGSGSEPSSWQAKHQASAPRGREPGERVEGLKPQVSNLQTTTIPMCSRDNPLQATAFWQGVIAGVPESGTGPPVARREQIWLDGLKLEVSNLETSHPALHFASAGPEQTERLEGLKLQVSNRQTVKIRMLSHGDQTRVWARL